MYCTCHSVTLCLDSVPRYFKIGSFVLLKGWKKPSCCAWTVVQVCGSPQDLFPLTPTKAGWSPKLAWLPQAAKTCFFPRIWRPLLRCLAACVASPLRTAPASHGTWGMLRGGSCRLPLRGKGARSLPKDTSLWWAVLREAGCRSVGLFTQEAIFVCSLQMHLKSLVLVTSWDYFLEVLGQILAVFSVLLIFRASYLAAVNHWQRLQILLQSVFAHEKTTGCTSWSAFVTDWATTRAEL